MSRSWLWFAAGPVLIWVAIAVVALATNPLDGPFPESLHGLHGLLMWPLVLYVGCMLPLSVYALSAKLTVTDDGLESAWLLGRCRILWDVVESHRPPTRIERRECRMASPSVAATTQSLLSVAVCA